MIHVHGNTRIHGRPQGVGARVDARPPGKISSCGGAFFRACPLPPPDKKFCGRQCMHTYIVYTYAFVPVCTMYVVYCNFAIYVRLLVNTTISI